MRAHFGGYFFGQIGTFMYLIQSMGQAEIIEAAAWPQFSVFNLVVSNFWPLYWLVYFIDADKLDETYWHVYGAAQARVADLLLLFQLISN